MTTTPNLPGPERVKSCREFLLYMGENGNLVEKEYAADLLAILDALPGLKAENAEYFKALQDIGPELTAKVAECEELKAENERLREDCDRTADVVVEQMEQIDKLKAELARLRDAAAEVISVNDHGHPDQASLDEKVSFRQRERDAWETLRAALAYREKAEKAGEKGERK